MFEQNIELFGKIRRQIQKFMPFGLSIKLILGGVLGILGGAGVLGYVSDYATYWYAINLGIRSPLEGVAYLKAAVTLGSIFLLVTSGIAFALSIAILRFFSGSIFFVLKSFRDSNEIFKRMAEIFHDEAIGLAAKVLSYANRILLETDISKLTLRYRFLTLFIFVVVGYPVAVFIAETHTFPLSRNATVALWTLYFSVAGLIVVFPRAVWPLAFILTAAYFAFCLFSLFQTDRYAWFLRTVGYGGGYPITIQAKSDQLKARLLGAKTNLVLRTNDTFILFDENRSDFIEVPKDEAIFITYGKGQIRYR